MFREGAVKGRSILPPRLNKKIESHNRDISTQEAAGMLTKVTGRDKKIGYREQE